MTLQQLRYITTVADTGTITEAAKKLYISQPSLTNAIHELEKEMGLTILTGRIRESLFPGKGKNSQDMQGRYWSRPPSQRINIRKTVAEKAVLRINTALLFCGKCLCGSGEKYGQEEYDFSLRETQTYKLIEDVAQMRSEIGILFLNDFNEK